MERHTFSVLNPSTSSSKLPGNTARLLSMLLLSVSVSGAIAQQSGTGVIATGNSCGKGNDIKTTCGNGKIGEDVTVLWTAPSAGEWEFDLSGSDYDTVLEVRDDNGKALRCDDDIDNVNKTSRLNYALNAGDQVEIVVDSYYATCGNYQLAVNQAGPHPMSCKVDGDISGTGTVATGSLCGAGNDSQTQCGNGNVGEEETFSWTAPSSGTWVFEAIGTNLDPVLELREPCDSGAKVLQCNDDSDNRQDSKITRKLQKGETLLVSVDTYGEACGDYELKINRVGGDVEPNPLPEPDNGVLRRLTDGENYASCKFEPTASQPRKNMPERPLGIKVGWDIPYLNYLTSNDGSPNQPFVDQLNERPFDGVVFTAGEVTTKGISDLVISEADIEEQFTHYDAVEFTGPKHNFVRLLARHIDGGYKEDGYDAMIDNLRYFARSASKRDTIKGIMFDPEFYWPATEVDPWDYSADICEGYTASEDGKEDGFVNAEAKQACDVNAYNRGYRAMKAMIEEWPDMEFLTLFGIWTDDARTFNLVNGAWNDSSTGFAPHVEWHYSKGVMPHFLAGMYAATICTDATYIDGTELYGLREESDFKKTAKFITHDIVDNNEYLPDNIKEAYRDEVGLGFGVYDDKWAVFANHAKWPIPQLTAEGWKTTAINASKVATHYVWLYTEKHDWWNKDPNNHPAVAVEEAPDWIKATHEAMAFIRNL